MGHFGAQAARAGPEPGRAGRKTIIVSSDLSERIDYNIPTCPYMPDGTHCRRSRTTAAHVTDIAIWNSSMSSAVRCNISSTAP